MTEEEQVEFFQAILDEYQEDLALADISGQSSDFFQENYQTTPENLAEIVDTMGQVMTPMCVRRAAVDRFGIPDDDTLIQHWGSQHLDDEAATCLTLVGAQMGIHMFLVGFEAAKRLSEREKATNV